MSKRKQELVKLAKKFKAAQKSWVDLDYFTELLIYSHPTTLLQYRKNPYAPLDLAVNCSIKLSYDKEKRFFHVKRDNTLRYLTDILSGKQLNTLFNRSDLHLIPYDLELPISINCDKTNFAADFMHPSHYEMLLQSQHKFLFNLVCLGKRYHEGLKFIATLNLYANLIRSCNYIVSHAESFPAEVVHAAGGQWHITNFVGDTLMADNCALLKEFDIKLTEHIDPNSNYLKIYRVAYELKKEEGLCWSEFYKPIMEYVLFEASCNINGTVILQTNANNVLWHSALPEAIKQHHFNDFYDIAVAEYQSNPDFTRAVNYKAHSFLNRVARKDAATDRELWYTTTVHRSNLSYIFGEMSFIHGSIEEGNLLSLHALGTFEQSLNSGKGHLPTIALCHPAKHVPPFKKIQKVFRQKCEERERNWRRLPSQWVHVNITKLSEFKPNSNELLHIYGLSRHPTTEDTHYWQQQINRVAACTISHAPTKLAFRSDASERLYKLASQFQAPSVCENFVSFSIQFRLEKILQDIVLGTPVSIFSLSGPSGNGKTEFAKELFSLSNCRIKLWLGGKNEKQIEKQIIRIAQATFPVYKDSKPALLLDSFRNLLEQTGDWLLGLDHIDDINTLSHCIPRQSGMVITTSHKKLSKEQSLIFCKQFFGEDRITNAFKQFSLPLPNHNFALKILKAATGYVAAQLNPLANRDLTPRLLQMAGAILRANSDETANNLAAQLITRGNNTEEAFNDKQTLKILQAALYHLPYDAILLLKACSFLYHDKIMNQMLVWWHLNYHKDQDRRSNYTNLLKILEPYQLIKFKSSHVITVDATHQHFWRHVNLPDSRQIPLEARGKNPAATAEFQSTLMKALLEYITDSHFITSEREIMKPLSAHDKYTLFLGAFSRIRSLNPTGNTQAHKEIDYLILSRLSDETLTPETIVNFLKQCHSNDTTNYFLYRLSFLNLLSYLNRNIHSKVGNRYEEALLSGFYSTLDFTHNLLINSTNFLTEVEEYYIYNRYLEIYGLPLAHIVSLDNQIPVIAQIQLYKPMLYQNVHFSPNHEVNAINRQLLISIGSELCHHDPDLALSVLQYIDPDVCRGHIRMYLSDETKLYYQRCMLRAKQARILERYGDSGLYQMLSHRKKAYLRMKLIQARIESFDSSNLILLRDTAAAQLAGVSQQNEDLKRQPYFTHYQGSPVHYGRRFMTKRKRRTMAIDDSMISLRTRLQFSYWKIARLIDAVSRGAGYLANQNQQSLEWAEDTLSRLASITGHIYGQESETHLNACLTHLKILLLTCTDPIKGGLHSPNFTYREFLHHIRMFIYNVIEFSGHKNRYFKQATSLLKQFLEKIKFYQNSTADQYRQDASQAVTRMAFFGNAGVLASPKLKHELAMFRDAIESGHASTVRKILKIKPYYFTKTFSLPESVYEGTVVHHAIIKGDMKLILFCEELCMNLNPRDSNGLTAVDLAIKMNSPFINSLCFFIKKMLTPFEKDTALSKQMFANFLLNSYNTEMVKIGIYLGNDLNLIEHNTGDTPLLQAARKRNYRCVEILLAAGASPHWRNKQGMNFFEFATRDNLLLDIAEKWHKNHEKYPLESGKPLSSDKPTIRL